MCLDARGLQEQMLVDGARRSTLDALGVHVLADQALVV
jgi:hypothetical protein